MVRADCVKWVILFTGIKKGKKLNKRENGRNIYDVKISLLKLKRVFTIILFKRRGF